MLEWIAFSRNRAYQLYALLESAQANGGISFDRIAIATRYDDDHLDSLRIVQDVFPSCRWLARTDFERDVRTLLDECGLTMSFATDDSLFTRPVRWSAGLAALCSGATAYSHSLGLHMRRFYTQDCLQDLPADIRGIGNHLTWNWRSAGGDWACMGSVDATQFVTADVKRWIGGATSPNTLEDALNANVEGDLGACGAISSYVTCPMNAVQTTHLNRNSGGSVEDLRDRFMAGQRPNVSLVAGIVNESAAQEIFV